MGRDTIALIAGGVAALAVVALLGLGLFGPTTVTTSSGPAVASEALEPPEDGSSGLVFGTHVIPGMSVFGIKFQADKHRVHIGFILPEECLSRDDTGSEHLLTDGVCADLPVRGEVAGGGTSRSGATLAIVEVRVTRDCYEALQVGDPWPPEQPECHTPNP